jgi:hypothetical protein
MIPSGPSIPEREHGETDSGCAFREVRKLNDNIGRDREVSIYEEQNAGSIESDAPEVLDFIVEGERVVVEKDSCAKTEISYSKR